MFQELLLRAVIADAPVSQNDDPVCHCVRVFDDVGRYHDGCFPAKFQNQVPHLKTGFV
jgi:hypothetical protein